MIKQENQMIYKCEYCTMVSKSSAAMYSHELSCKKNPHNDILCLRCANCKEEDAIGDAYSKCKHCDIRLLPEDSFERLFLCDGCHGYGADKTSDKVYRCKITGKLMYNRNIVRMEKARRSFIVERCDGGVMPSRADGCDNFIKKR